MVPKGMLVLVQFGTKQVLVLLGTNFFGTNGYPDANCTEIYHRVCVPLSMQRAQVPLRYLCKLVHACTHTKMVQIGMLALLQFGTQPALVHLGTILDDAKLYH
jgi:hypothetical protein